MSDIASLDRQRGAPGEVFSILGSGLQDSMKPPGVGSKVISRRSAGVPPILKRCDEINLKVVEWKPYRIRVRIPPGVPAGLYEVYAVGKPYQTMILGKPVGALKWPRTNFLRFWVTAAPVADTVTDNYDVQVKSFRSRYAKSAAWEAWMLANRNRYQPVFDAALAVPCPIDIATSYEHDLAYDPPWSSELEHMAALNRLADLSYPGYRFNFSLDLKPSTSYGRAILGLKDGNSHQNGRVVSLISETIFSHEFGHVLRLPHHYDSEETVGSGLHFPPGEHLCEMDRNSEQFCSACRTALNLPLDIDYRKEIIDAVTVIGSRYPPRSQSTPHSGAGAARHA